MTKTKPPKYCIDKGKKKAFVRIDGRKNYLPGRSGSPESREAYARFETEWWENSRRPVAERVAPTLPLVVLHKFLQSVDVRRLFLEAIFSVLRNLLILHTLKNCMFVLFYAIFLIQRFIEQSIHMFDQQCQHARLFWQNG